MKNAPTLVQPGHAPLRAGFPGVMWCVQMMPLMGQNVMFAAGTKRKHDEVPFQGRTISVTLEVFFK